MKNLTFGGPLNREGTGARTARSRKLLMLGLLAAGWLGAAVVGRADGVVADCTGEALRAALSGGGLVTFPANSTNCTITLNQPIFIPAGIGATIDAGGSSVTISGGGKVGLFNVSGELTLVGLKLVSGKSQQGGAVYVNSGGRVIATNCTFSGNQAVGPNGSAGGAGQDIEFGRGGDGGDGTAGGWAHGGAIYNLGDLVLRRCVVSTNTATGGNGGAGGKGGSGGGTLGQGGNGGAGGAGGASLGAAVYNGGNFTLSDTTFTANFATAGNGGAGGAAGSGPYVGRAGQGGAGAAANGGAIYNAMNLSASRNAFSSNGTRGGNSAAAGTQSSSQGGRGPDGGEAGGGGLCNAHWAAVNNSTFYANTARGGNGGNGGDGMGTLPTRGDGGNGGNAAGGDVRNWSTLQLVNCTVASGAVYGGTNGVMGGGSYGGTDGHVGYANGGNIAGGSGGTTLKGTLFGYAASGGVGSGTFTDAGYNMSPDGTIALGGQSFPNTTTLNLGTFGNHGGPTPTLSLLNSSPAINKIPPDEAPSTDQRGYPRPMPEGGLSDIGAYESEQGSGPIILAQPTNTLATPGVPVKLAVSAIGASPLLYYWQLDGTNIPGANSSAYTISRPGTTNVGPYDVVVSNSLGKVTSDTVYLSLLPAITQQPTNVVVSAGSNVTFAVDAFSDTTPGFQWSHEGTNLVGQTDAALTLTGVQVPDVGSYSVVVRNAAGAVTSAAATLNISPTLISQTPTQPLLSPGAPVTFRVDSTGTPPLSYQWQLNGTPIPGATNSVWNVAAAYTANSGSYSAIITNGYGRITSTPAALNLRLTIMQPPLSQIVEVGQTARFTVAAEGTAPLSYQWQFSSNNIPGATGTVYIISNVTSAAAGSYRVNVRDGLTNFFSGNATLTVPPYAAEIRGQITRDSQPLVGIRVAAVGTAVVSTTTDTSGNYRIRDLSAGSYTVTPQDTCYQFTPVSSLLTLTGTNVEVANFAAQRVAYSISGTVTSGTSGLSGVTVRAMVAGGSVTNAVGVTDASGQFTLSDLCPGNYVVTPDMGCLSFYPAQRSILVGSQNVGQVNFSGLTNDVYSISGAVFLSVTGLTGVNISVGGRTVQTDTNGNYSFTHLCPGPYTIQPALQGYQFQPASISVANLSANLTNQTFFASRVYNISGHITNNGAGLDGVIVRAAPSTNTAVTAGGGYYTLTGLAAGTYTVAPTQDCKIFLPATQSVTLPVGGTNVDFVALDNNIHAVRGRVMEGSDPLGGVTLQLGTSTAVSGSDGYYAFIDLCPVTTNLVPTLQGFVFQPAQHAVGMTNTDINGMDFSAYPALSITNTAAGEVTIFGGGRTNQAYRLESSTRLFPAPQWQLVTNGAAPMRLSEPVGGAEKFYRLGR